MRWPVVIFILALILVSACQPAAPTSPQTELRILASTTVLADLARNVAGDRAAVDSLLPPGADPHTYQPTPADVVKVSDSTLLILNGADYERTLQTIIDSADGQRQILTASTGLVDPSSRESVNPHFWVNPRFAIKYVENIRDGLIRADPANADAYTANAEAYIAQLDELDAWAEQRILTLPPGRRLLVTNHDALGYFADRYGFNVVGLIIPSSSDEAGASAEKLAATIDTVKSTGAPAIFLDKVENPVLADQVSSETGAEVVGDLYFESLSGADGPAPSYLEMIRHDVNRIVESLTP
jgi:zinc/manganese transport system substrate-binding protein